MGELLFGLEEAASKETDAGIKAMIWQARWVTVVSWLTYPVVYIIPLVGFHGSRAPGAQAVMLIQCGYCASDIISKCGVGLLIYQITYAKSNKEQGIATYAGKPGMIAKASQGSTPILIFKFIFGFTVLTFFY